MLLCLHAEWCWRSEKSHQQVDDIPQSKTCVLHSWTRWSGHALWWAPWVFSVPTPSQKHIFQFYHTSRHLKRYSLCTFFIVCSVCVTEDVFLLPSRDERNPMVYGVFTTTRWDVAPAVSVSIFNCFWSGYRSLKSVLKCVIVDAIQNEFTVPLLCLSRSVMYLYGNANYLQSCKAKSAW